VRTRLPDQSREENLSASSKTTDAALSAGIAIGISVMTLLGNPMKFRVG
jgi:hypothetical protein